MGYSRQRIRPFRAVRGLTRGEEYGPEESLAVNGRSPTFQDKGGLDTWEGAVHSLAADGGTALYDAIVRSVDALEDQGTQAVTTFSQP